MVQKKKPGPFWGALLYSGHALNVKIATGRPTRTAHQETRPFNSMRILIDKGHFITVQGTPVVLFAGRT